MERPYQPESIQEAIVFFSSPDNCREYSSLIAGQKA
jgi:hypothetical protein